MRRTDDRSFRKSLVALFLLASNLYALPAALAQAKYPDRHVTFVVGFEPGGPTDVNARILAEKLAAETGYRFIIENKPGAGGIVANTAIKNSTPDGYTLLFASSGSMTIVPAANKTIKYNPITDFDAVALVSNLSPFFIITTPQSGITDLKTLVSKATAAPNKYSFATPGRGAMNGVAVSAFADLTKIKIVDVPYKGTGPAVVGLLAGQVDFSVANTQTFKQHSDAGTIVPLAIIANQRSKDFPNVPTVAEAGFPEMMQLTDWITWQGIFAPKGTPPAAIDILSKAINRALNDKDLQARFAALDLQVRAGSTPESTAAFLAKDYASWKTVADRLQLTIE